MKVIFFVTAMIYTLRISPSFKDIFAPTEIDRDLFTSPLVKKHMVSNETAKNKSQVCKF